MNETKANCYVGTHNGNPRAKEFRSTFTTLNINKDFNLHQNFSPFLPVAHRELKLGSQFADFCYGELWAKTGC